MEKKEYDTLESLSILALIIIVLGLGMSHLVHKMITSITDTKYLSFMSISRENFPFYMIYFLFFATIVLSSVIIFHDKKFNEEKNKDKKEYEYDTTQSFLCLSIIMFIFGYLLRVVTNKMLKERWIPIASVIEDSSGFQDGSYKNLVVDSVITSSESKWSSFSGLNTENYSKSIIYFLFFICCLLSLIIVIYDKSTHDAKINEKK